MADTPTLPAQSGREIGRSGTRKYYGIITNEEYNRRLIGKYAIEQYEIMRRSDSTVHSALQVVKLPLLGATPSIEPATDDDGNSTPEDEKAAKFISRELLHRKVNFHDHIKMALTMLDFGHCVFEKVLELTEFEGQPLIGIDKLAYRKQTTIQRWSTSDDKDGIQQQLDNELLSIPRVKLMYYTHDKEGDNEEGISLLRYIYKDFNIKDKLTIVNAIALEKQGVGVPYAKETGDTAPSDWTQVEDTLRNFRSNEEAYIKAPKNIDIEMMDMKGQTTKEIIPTMNYHDARIMKSVLAGFMELGGQSGSGSQSLSKDLTSLFMKSEEALANTLIAVITEDLIKQLCDLNWSNLPNGYPKLSFGNIADDDTSALSTSLSALTEKGLVTPDADLEQHLRSILHLPAMSKEALVEYKEKKELAKQAAAALPTVTETKENNDVVKTNTNVATEKDKKTLQDQEDKKPKDIKASLEDLKTARRRVIEVMYVD